MTTDRTPTPAERAANMAQRARSGRAEDVKEWFHVDFFGESFDVFLHPPQTAAWVGAQYPGATVTEYLPSP